MARVGARGARPRVPGGGAGPGSPREGCAQGVSLPARSIPSFGNRWAWNSGFLNRVRTTIRSTRPARNDSSDSPFSGPSGDSRPTDGMPPARIELGVKGRSQVPSASAAGSQGGLPARFNARVPPDEQARRRDRRERTRYSRVSLAESIAFDAMERQGVMHAVITFTREASGRASGPLRRRGRARLRWALGS